MTKLSFQEINFLRHPEKFNPGHQRVHTHRIKKKMKQWNDDLDYIKRHQRALVSLGKRDDYDKQKAIEKEIREYWKRFPRFEFIPNFLVRLRQFKKDVFQVEKQVYAFEKIFNSPEFIQKYSKLKPEQQLLLKMRINEIHCDVKNCSNKIKVFLDYDNKLE